MTPNGTPEAPPPTDVPAAPEAGPPPASRPLPWARILLGLVLVAGALVLVFWPQGERLAISSRVLEDVAAGGARPRELKSVAPGKSARLMISIKPGPAAKKGSRLVCNRQARPRVLLTAPEDLVFEKATGALHDERDEIPMGFTVKEGAAPGPRRISVYVAAELAVEGRALVRPAEARTVITVTVGTAEAEPAKKPGAE